MEGFKPGTRRVIRSSSSRPLFRVVRTFPLLAVVTLLLAGCDSTPESTTGAASSPAGTAAETIRVIDGDSLLVAIGSSEAEIRLQGVNAPEGSECFGDEARDALEGMLSWGELTLVAGGEDTDQYGRLLRYAYADGLNINQVLLAEGKAVVLQGDHPADADFAAASDLAALQRLGMWAPDACGSDGPPSQVAIIDYVFNPPGPDADLMNEELVVIGNEGEDPIDMSGWILRDESTQHRYHFPNPVELPPGEEIVVHTGCGRDTTYDLYWCSDDPVWSNGGDTVILQLADGTVVARVRYPGDF